MASIPDTPPPQLPDRESRLDSGSRGLTALLQAASRGEPQAMQRLLSTVYDELRAIAQVRMNQERIGHTLQATALVNEAYLRLLGQHDVRWEGRGHFFRAAAEAMRKILIDHARARNADKRGGGKAALSISGMADIAAAEAEPSGILALDDAIVRLETVDAQAASVVRLRFYAGLPEHAVAEALGISERTARRDWAFARGWLRDALERDAS
ncbi:MAG: sigma-70 family RNA polymerase sigma factor [Phycisphaerales bacterium]|nr:sigma-70 family RNA polymerase sigma factor [Phycisphaerales bacterium]